jgi:hypothetical protein
LKTTNTVEAAAHYLRADLRRFGNEKQIDDYINFLKKDNDSLLGQAKLLSTWLNNGVYRLLAENIDKGWIVEDVPIEKVKLAWMGHNIFRRTSQYKNLLVEALKDRSMPIEMGYQSYLKVPPEIQYFLAKKNGDYYELIDGCHRAFTLGMQGSKTLRLVYPNE